MKTYPRVLAIAGSDSGGGAGIQADIKAISATGSYAATAITAITAQNTLGVQEVFPLGAGLVASQIRSVLDDIGADAIKIGMLGNEEIVLAVSGNVKGFSRIVLDPVMISTSGDRLLDSGALESLENMLIPQAYVITPNIPEAEALLAHKIGPGNFEDCARELGEKFGVNVLLKAGHIGPREGSVVLRDCLFIRESGAFIPLEGAYTETQNTHGTGCTLSSALASFLAQGLPLETAAQKAKDYITRAIAQGAQYSIGHGHGPVKHF